MSYKWDMPATESLVLKEFDLVLYNSIQFVVRKVNGLKVLLQPISNDSTTRGLLEVPISELKRIGSVFQESKPLQSYRIVEIDFSKEYITPEKQHELDLEEARKTIYE